MKRSSVAGYRQLGHRAREDIDEEELEDDVVGGGGRDGGRHTCAVTGGRTLCWGENRYGELYDGTHTPHHRPHATAIAGPIDTHAVLTCSTLSTGAIQCCGRVPGSESGER